MGTLRDAAARDPGNHFVENCIETGFGAKAEEPLRFGNIGRAHLHVVHIRVLRLEAERAHGTVNFVPDEARQIENRGGRGRGEVEILIERVRRLDASADAAGQVAPIGVMAHLISGSENPKRILAAENLGDEIGDDVRHGWIGVLCAGISMPEGRSFADSGAIERTGDGIWQSVLSEGRLGEIFGG